MDVPDKPDELGKPDDAPRPRRPGCGICSGLRAYEQAVQHVQPEETDTTDLPEAAGRLVGVLALRGSTELLRCPECGTYYLYESAYEFLIGFGGSYDEQTLTRLSDEEAAAYLDEVRPAEGLSE